MTKILYFLLTFLESGLAIFGIRAPFEQPSYQVIGHLGDGVEIRTYGPSVVVETATGGDAFSRLFHYIAGANRRDETIAMTAPVVSHGGALGRPAAGPDPVSTPVMRFFLPRKIADNPPKPTDPAVHIVDLPSRTVAALRFSGPLDAASIADHAKQLRATLAAAHRATVGAAYVLGYDPPFTIPFLRRNEVAIDLAT